MNGFTACLLALICGGLAPALLVASRGRSVDRLVGLELLSAVLVLVLLVFAQLGESYELILPLVLVPLSFAGTLVFTRLLSKGPDDAA